MSRLFLKHREARVAKEDNVPYVNGINGVLAFWNEIALSVSSSASRRVKSARLPNRFAQRVRELVGLRLQGRAVTSVFDPGEWSKGYKRQVVRWGSRLK